MSEFFEHFAVVDLETLAKSSTSAILSLGLVVSRYDDKDVSFDKVVKNGLYLKFDLKEQLALGRTTEKSTIEWWYEQDAEARKVLKPRPDDISILLLVDKLEEYFKSLSIDIRKVDLYDRNSFDVSKMQDVVENNIGAKVPWSYKHVFEISTMLRFLGFDRYAGIRVSDIPGATYHNALHDAGVDYVRIMKALHTIGT